MIWLLICQLFYLNWFGIFKFVAMKVIVDIIFKIIYKLFFSTNFYADFVWP